jgi:hypothetical protein
MSLSLIDPLPPGGEEVPCPLCGLTVSFPTLIEEGDGHATYLVVTAPGTWITHLRDEHPAEWAKACERQREANARELQPGYQQLPRKVDGTVMAEGEDVDSIRDT